MCVCVCVLCALRLLKFISRPQVPHDYDVIPIDVAMVEVRMDVLRLSWKRDQYEKNISMLIAN